MTYHVVIALPDGRTAVADYREPIVKVMHRIHLAISETGPGRLAGTRADYDRVAAWLSANTEQSARCREHLLPGGGDCGHD